MPRGMSVLASLESISDVVWLCMYVCTYVHYTYVRVYVSASECVGLLFWCVLKMLQIPHLHGPCVPTCVPLGTSDLVHAYVSLRMPHP